MMGWYGGWGGGLGWGGWIGMGLMMVVFWGLLGVGVVALVRSASRVGGSQPGTGERDPRQLLDEGLARGTLTVEEYLRRRDLLQTR